MKILCINPNSSASMTGMVAELARRAAGPCTELTAVNPAAGPPAIQTIEDERDATRQVLAHLKGWRIDDFDAAILACFGDPGLDELRAATTTPVVGIAEAAMMVASTRGRTFSIVAALESAVPIMTSLAGKYGVGPRLASVRAVGISVLDLARGTDEATAVISEVARAAVTEDGAEAVCLGCASLGPRANAVAAATGVPALDGVTCAVKVIEASGPLR
ncbi:aspartate/glutamate racemase family protein [Saccharopolyspora sp. ASAGF58]|uniref:aspartate/glutamate racemase family protein n=1 Tax=Saccharopolyspora sp. ASAGF58 TaxID=2719023 RepID=UPI0021133988|nr:aspartate/glutamate racemase family protein [Saccharopolyspora sp. ASAGF58]